MSSAAIRWHQMPEVLMLPHNWVCVKDGYVDPVDRETASRESTPLQKIQWSVGYGPLGFHTLNAHIEKTYEEYRQLVAQPFADDINQVKEGKILEIPLKRFQEFTYAMQKLDQLKCDKAALLKQAFTLHFKDARIFFKCLLIATWALIKIKTIFIRLRQKKPEPVLYIPPHDLEQMRSKACHEHALFSLSHTLWSGKNNNQTFHLSIIHCNLSQQLKFYQGNRVRGQIVISRCLDDSDEDSKFNLLVHSCTFSDKEVEYLFSTLMNALIKLKAGTEVRWYPNVPELKNLAIPRKYQSDNIEHTRLMELDGLIGENQSFFPRLIPINLIIEAIKTTMSPLSRDAVEAS